MYDNSSGLLSSTAITILTTIIIINVNHESFALFVFCTIKPFREQKIFAIVTGLSVK